MTRPTDAELVTALTRSLEAAEKMATEADAKFCMAFGGDGETSAYWLSVAVGDAKRDATALVARLAEPSEDTVRLDWLEQLASGAPVEIDAFLFTDTPTKNVVFLTTADGVRVGQGVSLRAAIDAARAK